MFADFDRDNDYYIDKQEFCKVMGAATIKLPNAQFKSLLDAMVQ